MVGRGKRKPFRKQGYTNPRKETKKAILLFLSTGKKNRQEILMYIKSKFKIKENRGIDKHLEELLSANVIQKGEYHRGHPICCFLPNGFDGLKQVFKYLPDQEVRFELLKSDYAQTQLNGDIFPFLSRDLITAMLLPTIRLMIMPVEEIRKDPNLSMIHSMIIADEGMKKIFEERRNEFLDQVKIGEPPDQHQPSIEELIQIFSMPGILQTQTPPDIIPLLNWISKLLFPINEQLEIKNILKSSISASTYIFSLNEISLENSLSLLSIYVTYYLADIIDISQKLKDSQENSQVFRDEIKHLIETQAKKSTTPILCLLQSEFQHDIVNGKVIENPWVKSYYVEKFIDNPALKAHYFTLINNQTKSDK